MRSVFWFWKLTLLSLFICCGPLPLSAVAQLPPSETDVDANLAPTPDGFLTCEPGCFCEASNTCWCPNSSGIDRFGGLCGNSWSAPWGGRSTPLIDVRTVCDSVTLNTLFRAAPFVNSRPNIGPCDSQCTQSLIDSNIVDQKTVSQRCVELDLGLPPTSLAESTITGDSYCFWDAPDLRSKVLDIPVAQRGSLGIVAYSIGLLGAPAKDLTKLSVVVAGVHYDPIRLISTLKAHTVVTDEMEYVGNHFMGMAWSHIGNPRMSAGFYGIALNFATKTLHAKSSLNEIVTFHHLRDGDGQVASFLVLPQFLVDGRAIPCPDYFEPSKTPFVSALRQQLLTASITTPPRDTNIGPPAPRPTRPPKTENARKKIKKKKSKKQHSGHSSRPKH